MSIDVQNPEETLRQIGIPSNSEERLLVGEAYFHLGEYHKAKAELDRGLSEIHQQSIYTSTVTEQLIAALCFLGKFKQASEAITRFKHLLDPDNLPKWRGFQSTHQWPAQETADWMEYVVMFWQETRGKRRPDLAEKMCRSLSKLSPDDPKVWFNLGRACADQEKYDLAIPAFTQHLKLNPRSLDGFVSRAWCHKLTDKFEECWEDIKQIRRIDPNDGDLPRLLEGLDTNRKNVFAEQDIYEESIQKEEKMEISKRYKCTECGTVFSPFSIIFSKDLKHSTVTCPRCGRISKPHSDGISKPQNIWWKRLLYIIGLLAAAAILGWFFLKK